MTFTTWAVGMGITLFALPNKPFLTYRICYSSNISSNPRTHTNDDPHCFFSCEKCMEIKINFQWKIKFCKKKNCMNAIFSFNDPSCFCVDKILISQSIKWCLIVCDVLFYMKKCGMCRLFWHRSWWKILVNINTFYQLEFKIYKKNKIA